MMQIKIFVALVLAATAMIAAGCSGCSQKDSAPPSSLTPPAQTAPDTSKASLPAPSPAKPAAQSPSVPAATREGASAKPSSEIKKLESAYYATSKSEKREIIEKLSMTEPTGEAIDAISRLLFNEQDAYLKTMLIGSLSDIEGEDDKKLSVLGWAISPSQSTEVRYAAIAALSDQSDEEDPHTLQKKDSRAMQMLHGLLNDPDEAIDIREAARNAIETMGATLPDEDLPEEVNQLEAAYNNTRDFIKRAAIIDKLSSGESPNVIDTITRMFLNERDPMLKGELIESLSGIDGENDKKLLILQGAVRDDQPEAVRLKAIEGLADTEDTRVMQVLQGLLKDSDKVIRSAARDAIEQLRTTMPPGRR
jgi:HEAT repeat protein